MITELGFIDVNGAALSADHRVYDSRLTANQS